MRIIFREKITDRIMNANEQAFIDGKEIEYIELTEKESDRFLLELKRMGFFRLKDRSPEFVDKNILGMFDGTIVKRKSV